MSGSTGERVAVVTASARSLPPLTYSIDEDMVANMTCTCPPSRSTSAGACAAIRHMHEGDAGHHLEQFTGNMVSGTDAGRRHVNLGGIGFGIGDEFWDRLDRYRGIHLHDKRLAMNARDPDDGADQIDTELVVECGVYRGL